MDSLVIGTMRQGTIHAAQPASRGARAGIVVSVIAALALAGAALALAPRGFDAGWLLLAQDDPELLADRIVDQSFSGPVAEREIAAALAAGDVDLADSFAALARDRGIGLDAGLADRLAAANTASASTRRTVEQFAHGLVSGEPDNLAGVAGSTLGDLLVFGDIRDAIREGRRFANGETADELVLGLACAGLAVTAGTYASFGAAAPARIGLTMVKAARKTRQLGAGLAAWTGRSLRGIVDLPALHRAAGGFSLTDPAAAVRGARAAVKLEKAGGISRLVGNVGQIQAKAGTQAALDGLKIAQGPRDMTRLARLAAAKGGKTRAILKLAGRAAIALSFAALDLTIWLFAAAVALFGFLSAVKSTCERATEHYLRRKKARLAAI